MSAFSIGYHIGITPAQGAEWALVTGDPGRVSALAGYLDDPMPLAQNREFTSWSGNLAGERVIVMSHGIGGPSMAICIEELARCGVHTVIRIGTCGGMQPSVLAGDLIAATAAIRAEGTSLEYLPVEYPAVADLQVTRALVEAAEHQNRRIHAGVVHCKDSFYGQHQPEESPVGDTLKSRWKSWIAGGCLASEMEAAALFTVAAVRGVRAGCVLQTLWNQERRAAGLPDDPVMDTAPAIETAIDALRRLIEEA
ncbi:MAG: nucleoside phosphorylase [Acutalibacteraceae bacterium]|jgi:uridine phosphorylase